MTGIVIAGAAGRMGRAVIESTLQATGARLLGCTVRSGSSLLGRDAGDLVGHGSSGVQLVDSLDMHGDKNFVVIDFSSIESTLNHVDWCSRTDTPVVIGTTGFSEEQESKIRAAATQIPVVYAPNFSVGVNVVFELVDRATRLFSETVDIEILEAHHRNKADAPSGTALALGRIVADALDKTLNDVAIYGREGQTGSRSREQIGFATLRAGDIVGEHTIMFAGEDERVEISHKASNRRTFSNGAVAAAIWVESQKPGLYSMRDVLGLDS